MDPSDAGKLAPARATTIGFRRAVALATLLVAGSYLFRDLPAKWLQLQDPVGRDDAIVVFAGDPDYERTTHAVQLMKEGRARILILTGGEPGPGDSADSLKAKAIQLGIPPHVIRIETKSRSTHESLLEIQPIINSERIESLALVTSPFHQRRAYLAARRAFPRLRLRNQPARSSSWRPQGWWRDSRSRHRVLSEYLKMAYYGVRGWT